MTYTITITNKNIDYDVRGVEVIDLSTISPSLITEPDVPYVEYQGDMSQESTSIYVPLYKRYQYVELKASSILVIQTDDSDEAIYYRSLILGNATILCDPDPISGESTNAVQALKDLYVALGGSEEDVQDVNSIVGVLNAISTMYGGETSNTISGAIEDIADVAGNIGGGSKFPFKRITAPAGIDGDITYLYDDSEEYAITNESSRLIILFGKTNKITGLSQYNPDPTPTGVDGYPYIEFTPGENFELPSDVTFSSQVTVTPNDGKMYYICIQNDVYYLEGGTIDFDYNEFVISSNYGGTNSVLDVISYIPGIHDFTLNCVDNNYEGTNPKQPFRRSGIDPVLEGFGVTFKNPIHSAYMYQTGFIVFTPASDFKVYNYSHSVVTPSGDTITNGDGSTYKLSYGGGTYRATKINNNFVITIE